jgi:hypothetical protein
METVTNRAGKATEDRSIIIIIIALVSATENLSSFEG